MNLKGCARNWSCSNSSYYTGICLEGLRKATKNFIRDSLCPVGVPVEIRTERIPTTACTQQHLHPIVLYFVASLSLITTSSPCFHSSYIAHHMTDLVIQYGCLIVMVTGDLATSALLHCYRTQLHKKQDWRGCIP
jgi:hypothetical protein